MRAYWRNPAATEAALDEEGWFGTGDMGREDEEGYLFLVDRKKDVILRGGYTVYPREIEDVLASHPDVLESVVLGVADETLGEEVVAVVVLRPGTGSDPEGIREFVRERVAAYKYPRAVVIAHDLPHSPTGKILRREIDRKPLRRALDERAAAGRKPFPARDRERRDGEADGASVPCRPRRQPAAAARAARGPARPRRRSHRGGRASGDGGCGGREAVRMQEDVGLQAATDGELRRGSWHMDFIYPLDGVGRAPGDILAIQFRNAEGTIEFTPAAMQVVGRFGVSETIFGDDFAMLRDTVTTATPKLTIPSPSMVHFRGGRAAIATPTVYPELDAFWSDLTAAYAEEVRRLGDLGCTYLQFDDTSLAYLNDPSQREYVAGIGGDPERQHLDYIRHINEALASRPDGMAVTTHMCRGNFRSSWAAEGGYDFVAEALFNELQVDGFFLEYDDERSGSFEPLRFVPNGKQVVLGLVTTKRGRSRRRTS